MATVAGAVGGGGNFQIQLDIMTRLIGKGFDDVKKQIEGIKKKTKDADKAIQKSGKNIGQWGRAFNYAGRQMMRMGFVITFTLQRIARSMMNVAVSIKDMIVDFADWRTKLGKVIDIMERLAIAGLLTRERMVWLTDIMRRLMTVGIKVSGAFAILEGWFLDLGLAFVTGLEPYLTSFTTWLDDYFSEEVDETGTTRGDLLRKDIEKLGATIGEFLEKAGKWLVENLPTIITTLETVGTLIEPFFKGMKTGAEKVWKVVKAIAALLGIDPDEPGGLELLAERVGEFMILWGSFGAVLLVIAPFVTVIGWIGQLAGALGIGGGLRLAIGGTVKALTGTTVLGTGITLGTVAGGLALALSIVFGGLDAIRQLNPELYSSLTAGIPFIDTAVKGYHSIGVTLKNILTTIADILLILPTLVLNFYGAEGYAEKYGNYGEEMMHQLSEGMKRGRGELLGTAGDIAGDLEDYLGANSPPRKGPLRNINKWGANLMNEYSKGMNSGGMAVTINVNGAQNPAMTSQAIERSLLRFERRRRGY